jgi:hypothetical protein
MGYERHIRYYSARCARAHVVGGTGGEAGKYSCLLDCSHFQGPMPYKCRINMMVLL